MASIIPWQMCLQYFKPLVPIILNYIFWPHEAAKKNPLATVSLQAKNAYLNYELWSSLWKITLCLSIWRDHTLIHHYLFMFNKSIGTQGQKLSPKFRWMIVVSLVFLRWSWRAAASSTTSTLVITWRWQSSWEWNCLQDEGCLCHREPSMKTERPHIHRPLTLRLLNQVGKKTEKNPAVYGSYSNFWIRGWEVFCKLE